MEFDKKKPLRPAERDTNEYEQAEFTEDINADEVEEQEQLYLPQAIVGKMIKQFLAALVFITISLGMFIWLHEWSYFIGVAVGLYFVFEGLWIRHDYYAGYIDERALLCINVLRGKNQTKLVMRDASESPNYYEFLAPTNKKGDFLVNAVYIIYINKKAPRTILAWQPLSYGEDATAQGTQGRPKAK